MVIESTMTYDDVAQTWRGIVHDRRQIPGQARAQNTLLDGWRDQPDHYGATLAQMTDWVDHGRLADGMTIKASPPSFDRQKLRFNDFDGELDVERLLDGDDRPFRLREKRQRQRAVRLAIQYNFRSNVDPSVLAAYAHWCAELIAGLQSGSFDLQIDVFSDVKMEILKATRPVRTNIRVKRFGKRSSLKSWGALFSPAGFRMLGFTARLMACHEHGVPCNPNMGASQAPGWGLSFDEETRTLTINTNASEGVRFPKEMMDTKLAALKV